MPQTLHDEANMLGLAVGLVAATLAEHLLTMLDHACRGQNP